LKVNIYKLKFEQPHFFSGVCTFLFIIFLSASSSAFEIVIKLTGDNEFPGMINVDTGTGLKFGRLCLLGKEARGSIDMNFILTLSEQGVPEGDYYISNAFPEEQWPTSSFSANGALRLVSRSEQAHKVLRNAGKQGLALHARDFFPLAGKMTDNPKMVRFFSDQLFDRLAERWGTLRISNWDMGRFHDFYRRNTKLDEQWKVKVKAGALAPVKKTCAPLKVQRKPEGPLE
jgi:hypothetical protein